MNASCVCVCARACACVCLWYCKLRESMKLESPLGQTVRELGISSTPRNYLRESIHANDGLEY